MKPPLISLKNPQPNPTQLRKWKRLSAIIAGEFADTAAQAQELKSINREIDRITDGIAKLEASTNLSETIAQSISAKRVQIEHLQKRLSAVQQAAAKKTEGATYQARLDAFNTLSAQVGGFFRDYIDSETERVAAIIAPLWEGYPTPDALGHARLFVKRSNLLSAVSERFCIRLREQKSGGGSSAAARLLGIVERFSSGNQFWAGETLKTL